MSECREMSLFESESSAAAVPVAGVAAVVSLRRRRKGWWWVKAIGLLLLCLFVSLLFITNVPTHLSAADIASMEKDLGLKGLPRPLTYEDEIRTVRPDGSGARICQGPVWGGDSGL